MNNKASVSDALISLRPGVPFYIYDDDYNQLEWMGDGEPPTREQVESEMERLDSEYAAQEYARKRASEYPPIGDQLDALFHAGLFPEQMAAQLQAVKDRHPK